MLDHVNIPVTNLGKSKPLYANMLAVLDMRVLFEDEDVIGLGKTKWDVGLYAANAVSNTIHLAFAATSREMVKVFYTEGLKQGALDNGKPGLRLDYGDSYYAAYLLDFDGHNIEMVCRASNLKNEPTYIEQQLND